MDTDVLILTIAQMYHLGQWIDRAMVGLGVGKNYTVFLLCTLLHQKWAMKRQVLYLSSSN